MRLSVIVPAYNAEAYIRSCLDSVVRQAFREWELICVDDGSEDGTASAVEAYARKDPRIRLVRQVNAGQGAARNRALREACGEFVLFLDADDELNADNAFSSLVEMADRKSLDVVQFDAETVFDPGVVVPDGAIRGDSYVRRRDYSAVRPGMIMFADMCLHREYTVSPCLAMIRRDLLNREGIFFPEGVVHEDVAFMARVLFAADRVAHCPSRFYRRFVHAGSTMTGRLRVENLRGCLAALRQYRIAGSGPNLPRRVRRALWHEIVWCKWQIRRIADRLDITESSASEPLESWERVMLAQAFSRPFLERLTDAFHCLQDNGLAYTVKRIVGGRRQ